MTIQNNPATAHFKFGGAYLEVPTNDRLKLYQILCLKDGEIFRGMTFLNKDAAEAYFVEEVIKMEAECCHSIQQLVDFRKNFGPHLYEIIEMK